MGQFTADIVGAWPKGFQACVRAVPQSVRDALPVRPHFPRKTEKRGWQRQCYGATSTMAFADAVMHWSEDKDMGDHPSEAFVRRQTQWDAFHRWESLRKSEPIPVEERIAWYMAAFRLSRALSAPDAGHIGKVTQIQHVRERLAHLKRALHNA